MAVRALRVGKRGRTYGAVRSRRHQPSLVGVHCQASELGIVAWLPSIAGMRAAPLKVTRMVHADTHPAVGCEGPDHQLVTELSGTELHHGETRARQLMPRWENGRCLAPQPDSALG